MVVPTEQRYLVWHDRDWSSIWFGAIESYQYDLLAGWIELHFRSDAPFGFGGEIGLLAEALLGASE